MGLTEKIMMGFLFAFLLLGAARMFAAPLKLALKVLLNTLLGFCALFLLNQAAAFTGFTLGINLFNAMVTGILGIPGLALLVLLKMVFL